MNSIMSALMVAYLSAKLSWICVEDPCFYCLPIMHDMSICIHWIWLHCPFYINSSCLSTLLNISKENQCCHHVWDAILMQCHIAPKEPCSSNASFLKLSIALIIKWIAGLNINMDGVAMKTHCSQGQEKTSIELTAQRWSRADRASDQGIEASEVAILH